MPATAWYYAILEKPPVVQIFKNFFIALRQAL
jgi:hypothetical protein